MSAIGAAEKGLVPDWAVRAGIRQLLKRRLREQRDKRDGTKDGELTRFMGRLRENPVAVNTDDANRQHYAIPAEFFRRLLGPHLKYSSGYWPDPVRSLPQSEEAMLALTCRRARLQDGQDVLELGCGWGSLALWMAAHYPNSRITAVSNSASQRESILATARERGLGNVRVVTADMNVFEPQDRFDRVVSVEMLEHMRNPEALLRRVAGWLKPDGLLFVHVFCHKEFAYLFETDGEVDWMARYFFTGGMMPSRQLLPALDSGLRLKKEWAVNGVHYARTLRAWLDRLDAKKQEVLALFRDVYGQDAPLWLRRWRLFLIACEELFRYGNGNEWFVAHYLMERA